MCARGGCVCVCARALVCNTEANVSSVVRRPKRQKSADESQLYLDFGQVCQYEDT